MASANDKKVGRIYLSFGITYGDIYVYPEEYDICKRYEEAKSGLKHIMTHMKRKSLMTTSFTSFVKNTTLR